MNASRMFAMGCLLATIALVWLLWPQPEEEPVATTTTSAKGMPAASQQHSTGLPQLPPNSATAAETKSRSTFFRREAQAYRERARYPKDNLALFAGQLDPISNDLHPVRREVRHGRSDYRVVVEGPMSSVTYPEPIVVRAWVMDGQGKRVRAEVTGTLELSFPRTQRKKLPMNFGEENDTHEFRLAPATPGEASTLAGLHNAVVSVLVDGQKQSVTLGWQYTAAPGATLTGACTDEIAEGHLLVTCEAQVTQAGRYHLQLVLATNETTIAWAQVAKELEPGLQHMTVRFMGVLFHDAQANGPYGVRRAWLRNVSRVPPRNGAPLNELHTTKPYSYGDFSHEPYDDPVDLDKADRLDRTAESKE